MGFVPSSSTIQLYAYFTEYARERIFNGDVPDFQVTQFSLHDEDVNYRITSNSDGSTNQPLTSGFLPDYTGDNDICIKSNKSFVKLGKNTLTGTTAIITPGTPPTPPPPPSGSRTLIIGFPTGTNTPIDDYGSSTNLNKKNFSYNLSINLTQNIGEPNPTQAEITSTSVIVELVEPPLSPVVLNGSIKVNNIALPATVNFGNSSNLIVTLSFNRDSTYNPNPAEIDYTEVKVKLTSTNPNRQIDPTKSTFIYRANIYSA